MSCGLFLRGRNVKDNCFGGRRYTSLTSIGRSKYAVALFILEYNGKIYTKFILVYDCAEEHNRTEQTTEKKIETENVWFASIE